MKENITADGSVIMLALDAKTGQIIDRMEDHNLVVNLGKQNVARLIGGNAQGAAVTKISVGEGSAAPKDTDTSLTNPYTKSVDAVTYPTSNSVQFSFSLGSSDANGMSITELGLIAGNKLFSRKTRSAIAKTSSVVITGLWTITIN